MHIQVTVHRRVRLQLHKVLYSILFDKTNFKAKLGSELIFKNDELNLYHFELYTIVKNYMIKPFFTL